MTATEVKLLPEQALANRWLRSRFAPLEVWQWLAGRVAQVKLTSWSPAPELRRLLSALSQPVASQSNQHERAALERNLSLTASLIAFIHGKSRGPALACQERMLAACLLPLYRGLARGTVEEVTSIMRRQLADALTLSALINEFEGELADVLSESMAQDKTPYEVLKSTLKIELELVAQRMLMVSRSWSGNNESELQSLVRNDIKTDERPEWGSPEILWRLAGELVADRSEFVVPREWVQVAVPWNEASEHWRSIAKALESCDANCDPVCDPPSPPAKQPRPSQSATKNDPHHTSAGAGEMDEVARLKLEIEISNSVDALVQSSREAAQQVAATSPPRPACNREPHDDFVIPKIIIAEIRSHNDPAFVAVIRRQLAICRGDERCVSLVAARVQPDGDGEGGIGRSEFPTLRSLGLSTWQQKLVNWMAELPEVNDPYAFVSSQGELILCLIDIERIAATVLLRQGLVKVLTGRSLDGDAASSLARAQTPALFHSGIASVSAPTASFEAEQLIEAAYRCLAAAERHGKGSIKSIEVF